MSEQQEQTQEDVVSEDATSSDTQAEANDQPETLDLAVVRELPDEELQKLIEMAADAEKYLDLARRTQAEFDNYQKRAEKQRREESRYAIVPLVREMLGGVDNLDRALASAESSKEFEPLYEGVGMTHKMLVQTLEKFGVKAIDAQGEAFDPEIHDAVMMGNEADKEDNLVLACFERGWKLHERVIRPAKVRVNKVEGVAEQAEATENGDAKEQSE